MCSNKISLIANHASICSIIILFGGLGSLEGGSVPSVSYIYRSPACVLLAPQFMVFQPNISWAPPTQGIIKINIDRSFSSSSLASGIGGVFRNHRDSVLLQFAKKVEA